MNDRDIEMLKDILLDVYIQDRIDEDYDEYMQEKIEKESEVIE